MFESKSEKLEKCRREALSAIRGERLKFELMVDSPMQGATSLKATDVILPRLVDAGLFAPAIRPDSSASSYMIQV